MVDHGSTDKTKKYIAEASARGTRRARRAVLSFRRKKRAKLRELEELKSVWVTLVNSRDGGNCNRGTKDFAKRVRELFGRVEENTIGAVRADIVLKLEDSPNTRRAIYAAKKARNNRKHKNPTAR